MNLLPFPHLVLPLLDATPSAPASLSLWQLIKEGGWAMYPLGFCSLATLFLIIHAVRETRKPLFVPKNWRPESFDPSPDKADTGRESILERCLRLPESVAQTEKQSKVRWEESAAERLEQEDARISQWINYLNVVATVAPMIGLLGTVSGMIGAFQTIATGGMGRPEMLAGNIGEALITTAVGLIIGIPAMVAFYILRNRLGNRMMTTASEATRTIETLMADV